MSPKADIIRKTILHTVKITDSFQHGLIRIIGGFSTIADLLIFINTRHKFCYNFIAGIIYEW